MKTIKYRFLNHQIAPDTETLIIGTLTPDIPSNHSDFFYGNSHDFLWRILPLSFQEKDLMKANKEEKIVFIHKYKIDFINLINSFTVEKEENYDTIYIDKHVAEWRDVIKELKVLTQIKRVGFIRRSFSGIPNIKQRIEEIEKYCIANEISFQCLVTPSRFYNEEKQKEWDLFLKT